MTSFIHLGAVARRSLAAALLLGAACAQAQSIQYSTGQVDIEFDPSTFNFTLDTTSFGGISTIDVSPFAVSYSQIAQGVELNFNGYMGVYATSYFDFSPQTLSGYFNAQANFTPAAGYAITGYTVTYTGSYSVETPGYVSLGDGTGAWFGQNGGASGFSVSSTVAGPIAPSLNGSFSATGDLATIEVFDGYDSYIDHYEDVLDYCDSEEPFNCYYHSEPVYVSLPIYHEETDLGEATFNLQSIRVQANVVAVPEPGALALVLGGLAMTGRRLRRQGARGWGQVPGSLA